MQPDLAQVRDLIAAMAREGHPDGEIASEIVRRWPDLDSATAADLIVTAQDPEPRRPVKAPAGPDPSSRDGDLESEIRRRLSGRGRPPSTAKIVADLLAMPNFSHCTPGQLAPEVERVREQVENGKAERKPSEAEKGERLAGLFCDKFAGLVRVDKAPMHQRDPVDWFLLDPVSRWETELTSSRLHDLLQELNQGEKLSPAAFASACWYAATDPRMHADDRQPLPRTLATDSGVFSFDLGRFLREDEPGTSAIRVALPLCLDAPPISETAIWKNDLVHWGQPEVHVECELGRVAFPGPSDTLTLNYGVGGAGMTTFAGLLRTVFGTANTVDISLDDLQPERLQRTKAALEFKLLWTADDCEPKGILGRGHVLKELSTATDLTGARLYRNPRSFKNTAHGRTHGNKPFKRDDRTVGMEDRAVETWWTARIRKTSLERVDILQKWEAMREDLAILFSRGVFRALERLATGRWADEPTSKQKKLFAQVLRWTETRFLWECLTHAPGQFLTWEAIEDAYNDWWPRTDRHDRPGFSQARFHRAAVLSFGQDIREDRVQIAGLRQRGLWNLDFLPSEDGEDCDFSSLAKCGQSAEWPQNRPSSDVLFSKEEINLLNNRGHIESVDVSPDGSQATSTNAPPWVEEQIPESDLDGYPPGAFEEE
jgi:hypothetical protein